jgi:hypothetical protein
MIYLSYQQAIPLLKITGVKKMFKLVLRLDGKIKDICEYLELEDALEDMYESLNAHPTTKITVENTDDSWRKKND